MSTTRKFYTRVKENLVMLVEIHALATASGQSHWFEDKHLQETVQIVKEAIESRLTQTQSAVKGTQQNSSIITGDSIRLGYVFKVRPSSQHCLLPPSSLTQQEQQELEEEDLHSLAVAKEKLIIYVCQRQVGSPQGMSQLVRVLGEKTNSTSKGISISSYFHRVSGGTKSGLSSITSSPGPADVAPKSGGKRNILKKILQQADKNVSRKKQQKSTKPTAAKRDSTIHKFLGKEVESDSSNKAAATAKTSPESLPNSSAEVRTEKVSNALSQSMDNAAQKSQNTAEVSMNTSEDKVIVTQINTMPGRVSNQEDKPGEMEPDDKSKKSRSEKMNESESELNKEELENLDCTLIEELASAVKVKDGSDSEIMKEIRELREVDELNEEHLNFMVRHSESYLRDIFEGKIHSSRHMAYKKGGISKRDLNYGSCLNLYSEEQIDTVMEALMKIFCKRHHKYLDYIMKVLLPEMLIKFHMEIHNLTKEESEKKLLP